jgi:phage/plasmid-associated DNA primase
MTKIIYLSLGSIPEDNKHLVETFSFNPEQKEATLKLNGVHKEIPEITFPISFDRYKDFETSCIENFKDELDKIKDLDQVDKTDILGVLLVDHANKSLILGSIKQYHRENLEQEPESQLQEHEQKQQNKEQEQQKGWENDYYDVWGRKVPEQENRKSNKNDKQELIEQGTELVKSKYRLLTLEETKEILYYDEEKGVYSYGGEILIEKELEDIFKFEIRKADIAEINGHIMRTTYVKKEEFDADLNIHNFKNGLYNIRTGELKPHTPDYYSLNQKPFLYNPKARSKHFVKFLKEVLYLEDIPTAIDIIAYTFVKYNPHELYFILIGIGSNGKSVYTGIIINLH